MKIHEYQGKEILARYGVRVQRKTHLYDIAPSDFPDGTSACRLFRRIRSAISTGVGTTHDGDQRSENHTEGVRNKLAFGLVSIQ
jgi:hypothetical protein